VTDIASANTDPLTENGKTRLIRWLQQALRAASPYAFLLPGLALFGLFIVYPLLYSLRISFYDWNVINTARSTFVGLENYVTAIESPVFRRAVVNTLAYTVLVVPAELVLSFVVALLIDQHIRFKDFFRVVYYLPVLTSWVIVTLVFEYLFNSQAGMVNYLLVDVLHLVAEPVRWLAEPELAYVPIVLLSVWKGIGWSMVIMFAGLQEIPDSLLEVAAVDGATPWQRLRYITLPLMRPTLVFLLVVRVIGGLNVYIPVLLMTNGGQPLDLTHSVLTLMYERTFDSLSFGEGAAISYLLTIFIFVISVIQIRMLRSRVES
jgi:multiple sugar transport system permease protein